MIDIHMMNKIKKSLKKHEGWENFPYVDTVGKITIGCGYNLTDRGISDDCISKQLRKDITDNYNQLAEFKWFMKLNNDRKVVILDMAFMGIKKLLGFKKMIKNIENDDYKLAAMEMLDSKWARQVKKRANNLANGMLKGVYKP